MKYKIGDVSTSLSGKKSILSYYIIMVVYLIPCPSDNYCFPQDIYIKPSVIAHSLNCVIYGDFKFATLCKILNTIFRIDLRIEGYSVMGIFLIVQFHILFSRSSYLCPRKTFYCYRGELYLKSLLLSPS